MKASSARILLLAGAVLALAGAALVWQGLQGRQPAQEPSGPPAADTRQSLPVFALHGPRGAFGNADLAGRWTFLFFGYTRCPDVCPTTLSLMTEAKGLLAGASAPVPQVVFVSVDPRRDTDPLLAEYLAAFDQSFIGVSGDDASLAPLTVALGVRYQRLDASDVRNYTVDHSAAIYLLDPQGRVAAVFPPPQTAGLLASTLRRLAQP